MVATVATIKFGASLSLSGRYARQGRQALAGLLAWARTINAAGGVRLGAKHRPSPVEVIYYNDSSSTGGVRANVERLIAVDQASVLIGPYGSDLTRAAASVAHLHGRALWNHGGAADDIHHRGRRIIGVLTPASRYFQGLVEMLVKSNRTIRTAAVLHREASRFGHWAATGLQLAAKRAKVEVTAVPYRSPQRELPDLAVTLGRLLPDVLVSAGAFEDEVAMAEGIIASGLRPKAFALVAAALQDFRDALRENAEGLLGPSQWEPTLGHHVDFGPTATKVVEAVGQQGLSPDYPAGQAYAACLIAQRCLEVAGGPEDDAVWQAACSFDLRIFFGRFRIDPSTGLQLGHEMVWVQWQGDRKVVIWPDEVAQGRLVYPRP